MRKFLSVVLAVMIVASVAVVSFSAAGSGVATVTLKSVKGDTVTKTYAVGDTITAYTYLNTTPINDGKIGALDGTQSFTTDVLELADAYDNEGSQDEFDPDYNIDYGMVEDTDAMFPVIGGGTIANAGHPGFIYFNASTPAAGGFKFNADGKALIITHYTVKAAGTAVIENTMETLAASDFNMTRIINGGVIENDNFTSAVALSDPTLPLPEGFTVSGTATSYLTTTGEGNDDVTLKLTGADNNFTDSTTVTAEYSSAKAGAAAETAYSFEYVPAGSYVLSVEKKNHVTREYEVTVSADTTQDVVICPKGDTNNDGAVKANDATAAYRHAQGKSTITDEYKLACANVAGGDALVKTNDATAIYRHSAGKKSLFE